MPSKRDNFFYLRQVNTVVKISRNLCWFQISRKISEQMRQKMTIPKVCFFQKILRLRKNSFLTQSFSPCIFLEYYSRPKIGIQFWIFLNQTHQLFCHFFSPILLKVPQSARNRQKESTFCFFFCVKINN